MNKLKLLLATALIAFVAPAFAHHSFYAEFDQNKEVTVAKTATLEVTPKQAEIISVVADIGKLSLTLRSLGHDENETGSETAEAHYGARLTLTQGLSCGIHRTEQLERRRQQRRDALSAHTTHRDGVDGHADHRERPVRGS